MCAICCQLLWNIPRGIEMVSVCTVPARGGRSCEHFGGYKTINRIPLLQYYYHYYYLNIEWYLIIFSFAFQILIKPVPKKRWWQLNLVEYFKALFQFYNGRTQHKVANVAKFNRQWCKKAEKWLKPWHKGTHLRILCGSYSMNSNMKGLATRSGTHGS